MFWGKELLIIEEEAVCLAPGTHQVSHAPIQDKDLTSNLQFS